MFSLEGQGVANVYSFFATMLHPVFFTSGATRFVEVVTNEETGEYYNARGKVIREYRHKAPWRGVAANGQPAFQVRLDLIDALCWAGPG
jgi:hypothetical protein